MDTLTQPLRRLEIGLATAALAFVLSAIPAHADTIVGLGPSTIGSISLANNGTGSVDLTLSSVLSGAGYEFDSGGTGTIFNISSTPGLSTFSSSDQDTTLSLDGGPATPVTWVDMGGGPLPGILILQFTTALDSPGTYDDLVLNITSLTEPYESPTLCGTFSCTPATPAPPGFNLCDVGGCTYNSLTTGGGTIVTSYIPCGQFDLQFCANTFAPDPITGSAYISSGEVFVGTDTPPTPTPEPSTLSLLAAGLISMFGLRGAARRKGFDA